MEIYEYIIFMLTLISCLQLMIIPLTGSFTSVVFIFYSRMFSYV